VVPFATTTATAVPFSSTDTETLASSLTGMLPLRIEIGVVSMLVSMARAHSADTDIDLLRRTVSGRGEGAAGHRRLGRGVN